MLVENRRRTIILKSATEECEEGNIEYEEVLSEEDIKNFSIVNIQALAGPNKQRNEIKNNNSTSFGSFQ